MDKLLIFDQVKRLITAVAYGNLSDGVSSQKAYEIACEQINELQDLMASPLKPIKSADNVEENGYCAVAMIEPALRAALQESLKEAGIGTGVIYPGAMSMQEGADGYLAGKIDNGNAHYVSQAVLNLPCFAYMTDQELAYVVEKVKAHFAS